ncbi:MAG TPA: ATP-binding protein [Oleiagrimonas sp.]|nr:ATP-binding protein [Oleiagrimonas sp.]
MSSRRPLSLAARSTLATVLVLVAFLSLTGLALDRAYYEGARSGLQDRLQGFVYALLAGTDVNRGGRVLVPDTMPNANFLRPGSGLYAIINGANGFHWESPSAIGRSLPLEMQLEPGKPIFRGPLETDVGDVYVYSLGVVYETPSHQPVHLVFSVAQTQTQFENQLAVYRRTLFVWLFALGLVLVILQLWLLRWSLSPLRRLSVDLARIKRGDSESLTAHYPFELSSLTHSLNAFIHSEREHLARYRNTLADLAHSLKTPLAVIRARLDAGDVAADLHQDLASQVRRMDELVAYQLSRAATSGHQTFATPVPVATHAEDLVQSLEKVYATKGVLCEFDIEETGCFFYGEQGDLLELMGNLLENAFKWSRHRVLLSIHAIAASSGRGRNGLVITVEDDGPGIVDDQIERVLQRGVRGDERVHGHGIGLAIVQDIVKAYNAQLDVGPSEELGGACFRVRFAAGS